MEAKLIVVSGDAAAGQYDLELPAIIGRSRGADVTLVHPLVSRQHCEVFEANGLLMVRDLGSRNGTFVGETRIADEAMPVKPGDLITVGPVTFRAVYRTSAERSKTGEWDGDGRTVDAPLPERLDNLQDTTVRQKRARGSGSGVVGNPPA